MSDSVDPFAPPHAPTLESPPSRAPVASRLSRLGATCIDGVFGVLCWFVALQLVKGVANVTPQPGESLGSLLERTPGWLVLAAPAAPFVLYAVPQLLMLRSGGWTIGKRLVGIRIVRTDGSRASPARLFWLRMFPLAFGLVIPFVGWLALLIDALFIFGAAQRCLHDLAADTIVVTTREDSRRPVRRGAQRHAAAPRVRGQ